MLSQFSGALKLKYSLINWTLSTVVCCSSLGELKPSSVRPESLTLKLDRVGIELLSGPYFSLQQTRTFFLSTIANI